MKRLLLLLLISCPIFANTLTVGIESFPPCVIISSEKVTGFDIELFEAIANELGFQYKYEEIGDFSRLFDDLSKDKYDIAVSGITINDTREKIVDFSHPYLRSGLSILIKNEKDNGPLRIILTYFKKTWKTLLALLVFLLLCGVLIWYFEKGKPSFNDKFLHGLGDGIYWTNTTMTTVGYGDKAPQTPIGKLFAMIVQWIGIVIVFPFVVAQMTQTVQDAAYRINSVEELRGHKIATVNGTTSCEAAYRYGAIIIKKSDIEECYQLLLDKKVDAVIFDMPVLKDKAKKDDQVIIVGNMFDEQDYGFAFPQGSPLREQFNQGLLKLIISGKYQEINDKWFKS